VTRDVEPADPGSVTRTLARGLRLLQLIGESEDGAGVSELAQLADLDKGTTSRLLATLRESGWARQDPSDRRYRLAGRALALAHGSSSKVDLRGLATPTLAGLRDEFGETVHLGVLEGGAVLLIDRLQPQTALHVVTAIGQRFPVSTTALGRTLMPLEADLPAGATLDTQYPIEHATDEPQPTDMARSRSSEIAIRNYAVDQGETIPDVTCIGAPIRDASGMAIAALSISAPTFRIMPKLEIVGSACLEAAGFLSECLGAPTQGGRLS
jgi:DNA-binding IclR family transcriptional regulator